MVLFFNFCSYRYNKYERQSAGSSALQPIWADPGRGMPHALCVINVICKTMPINKGAYRLFEHFTQIHKDQHTGNLSDRNIYSGQNQHLRCTQIYKCSLEHGKVTRDSCNRILPFYTLIFKIRFPIQCVIDFINHYR